MDRVETVEGIQHALVQFCGTENIHRLNVMCPVFLTDGAEYLAEHCHTYWLMDMIASYIRTLASVRESFAVITLTVDNSRGTFVMEDGNEHLLATRGISYTDFPLDGIKLYVEENDYGQWVVMLPSER